MPSLPENADPKVRLYFEYYERRLQGQPVEEIAQALGLWSPDTPDMLPTDIYWLLKRKGFPVCGVCGETPAPAGHCEDLSRMEELNLTEYARRRMQELSDTGLSQPDVESRAIPKEGVPTNTCGAKAGDDALPVRLRDGRTAWIRFDSRIEEHHGEGQAYWPARVYVDPPNTDLAILAALTVLDAEYVDPGRVSVAYCILETLETNPKGLRTGLREDARLKGADFSDLLYAAGLDFPIRLLAFYRHRPEFHDFPKEQRTALLKKLCAKINALLEAARDLYAYLEYGGPRGLSTSLVKDAERDIRAAELKDTLNVSYVKVGEILLIPLDREYQALKGSNKRVEDMVKRGRKLLVRVLGEEGYWQHIEAVKPYLEHWYSLFEEGRLEELTTWADEGHPLILSDDRYMCEGGPEEGEFWDKVCEVLDDW